MGISKGDEVFVNEIKAGNEMAFEAMVLKYQPKLMSSLIGYTKIKRRSYVKKHLLEFGKK